MDEKNYWKVTRGGIYAVLTCPICNAWFDIPNAPGNAESYHFCPGCSKPLEMHDEDKRFPEPMCYPGCDHLISRQEDYDDEPMGYCADCSAKYIDSMDNIYAGEAECVLEDQKGKCMYKNLFNVDKIYRFIDGRNVVITRTGFGWKFNYRDVTKFTIFEMEMKAEREVVEKLAELECDDLTEAIDRLNKFCPGVQMPPVETIRAGIVAGLEDFSLMDDV